MMRRGVCGLIAVCAAFVMAPAAGAQVLRVGTYNGIPGQFDSIQAAVNAARPGDTILAAPGDYKTTGSSTPRFSVGTKTSLLVLSARPMRGAARAARPVPAALSRSLLSIMSSYLGIVFVTLGNSKTNAERPVTVASER